MIMLNWFRGKDDRYAFAVTPDETGSVLPGEWEPWFSQPAHPEIRFVVIRLRVTARSTNGSCSHERGDLQISLRRQPPRSLPKAAPVKERHAGGASGESRGVASSTG
jgi:hypothetical protein